jgi:hypothetical protein
MTVEEFAKQSIDDIVMHPDFVNASTIDKHSVMYWEVNMKCRFRSDGFYFLDKKLPIEIFTFYKHIKFINQPCKNEK